MIFSSERIAGVASPPQTAACTPLTYIPALDGVRAVAIISIMLYHLRSYFGNVPVAWVLRCGWAGVDVFFTLSGFLITRRLLECRGKKRYFRNFYKKRALRIWPLYYSLVGIAFLYYLHAGRASSVPWWSYLSLTQNLFIAGFGIEMLRMTWCLAIEQQFYIVWPVLIFAANRKWLTSISVVLLAAEPVIRVFFLRSHAPVAMYLETFTHLDGIVIGSLLAIWITSPRFAPRTAKVWLWLSIIAGCTGTALLISPNGAAEQRSALLFTCLAFASAGLIGLCSLSAFPLSPVLELRPVRYVGKISYGLYLLHIQTFDVIDKAIAHFYLPVVIIVIAKVACAVLVASVSWHLFESKILTMGRSRS